MCDRIWQVIPSSSRTGLKSRALNVCATPNYDQMHIDKALGFQKQQQQQQEYGCDGASQYLHHSGVDFVRKIRPMRISRVIKISSYYSYCDLT